MNVTVLYGGPSSEREVSLVSGASVIEGLRSMRHNVFASDISPQNLSALDHPADVIFPVLHGQFGESGELQEILESRQLAFVGSGSRASRTGIDKVRTKIAWRLAGLPTPAWVHQTKPDPTRQALHDVGIPCVVKAVSAGSSISVYVCKTLDAAVDAFDKVMSQHGSALVEQYINGPELTVGLLEEKPLAPIRIIPKSEFFDYEAKYKSADTQHLFDTGLPASLIAECRDLAHRANDVVGAVDLARIDIMIDPNNKPQLLEINTLPGFTPKSLLPEAAKHAGIEFGPLVDLLVRRAKARGPRTA